MVMPTACYDPATGDLLGIERGLLAIYNDLNALSTAQKNAIWADFTGGTPAKWSTDLGPHADAVSALSIPAIVMHTSTAFTAAEQLAARLRMVAAYLLDEPLYLRNPAFDPTVNVVPYTA
jgi:hypothetical protein